MVIFLDSQHRVIKHSKSFFRDTKPRLRSILEKLSAKRKNKRLGARSLHIITLRFVLSRVKRINSFTERIIKACQFMDFRVLDHIMIGRGEYVSFAERGWIQPLCAILRDLCLFGT